MKTTCTLLPVLLHLTACGPRYPDRASACPQHLRQYIPPGTATWETTSRVGEVAGVIETPDGRVPRDGASVDLPWLGQRALVIEGGAFRFQSLPPGRQLLRVRILYHGALLDTIDVPATAGLHGTVRLQPIRTIRDECGIALARRPWWKVW